MITEFHDAKFASAEARAEAASLPPPRRQWMVDRLLVPHPNFKAADDATSRFHRPVVGGMPDKGSLGGLIAEPRSGKTWLTSLYASRFPAYLDEEAAKSVHPVVRIEAREDWTPYDMALAIFYTAGGKSLAKLKLAAAIDAAVRRLIQAETELLIIDDAHFAFGESSAFKLKGFKSVMKAIIDANTCNVLLSGLPMAEAVIRHDPQIQGRGGFPVWRLPSFDWKSMDDQAKFKALLKGIDSRLPFMEPSRLGEDPVYVESFYGLSKGAIGMVMNVVKDAAYRAISAGSSHILLEHLVAAGSARMSPGETAVPFKRAMTGVRLVEREDA